MDKQSHLNPYVDTWFPKTSDTVLKQPVNKIKPQSVYETSNVNYDIQSISRELNKPCRRDDI